MPLDPNHLPKLDRIVQFDEKSRQFAAVRGIEQEPFKSNHWPCDVYNDQGSEGACVGFAWTHELAAEPVVIRRDATFANAIYKRAQFLDPWPGENYEGTSVLAGIKALQEIKNTLGQALITEYRWAFGIEDILRVLAHKGPLVLGVDWFYNMYFPNAEGFIAPVGQLVGGHAILAKAVHIVNGAGEEREFQNFDEVDQDKSYVLLHNSWGRNYGLGGDAKITIRDLITLINRNGEACIPVVRNEEAPIVEPVVPVEEPVEPTPEPIEPVQPEPQPEDDATPYFVGKNQEIYHDSHKGIYVVEYFSEPPAGARPCKVCKPGA